MKNKSIIRAAFGCGNQRTQVALLRFLYLKQVVACSLWYLTETLATGAWHRPRIRLSRLPTLNKRATDGGIDMGCCKVGQLCIAR